MSGSICFITLPEFDWDPMDDLVAIKNVWNVYQYRLKKVRIYVSILFLFKKDF